MSTRSQLTKDLNGIRKHKFCQFVVVISYCYNNISESVKALLGKNVKILFKNVVKLETKADKQENRVLVCRIYF